MAGMDENPYKAPADNGSSRIQKRREWEPLDVLTAVILALLAGALWIWLAYLPT